MRDQIIVNLASFLLRFTSKEYQKVLTGAVNLGIRLAHHPDLYQQLLVREGGSKG